MFIKNMSCISAQKTYADNSLFEGNITPIEDNIFWATEPKYKGLIPLGLLRRMSKLVRMSVGTALPLLNEYKTIDSIIFASANGSAENSSKFLNQIIEYDEGTLTPTNFVQSTSNAVAGILAVMGKKTGYNNTHINQGLAFEAALLDALMLFEEGKSKQLLLGGGEEMYASIYNIDEQLGFYKDEKIDPSDLLTSKSKGTLPGEGVTMFVIDDSKDDESLSEIVDVDMISTTDKSEVLQKLNHFLTKNNLGTNDIDTVFMGRNGDQTSDDFYSFIENETFNQQTIVVYKHLIGEYYTSPAFALWLATSLLKGEQLPASCYSKTGVKKTKNILLYNHYNGNQHGFILLKGV